MPKNQLVSWFVKESTTFESVAQVQSNSQHCEEEGELTKNSKILANGVFLKNNLILTMKQSHIL